MHSESEYSYKAHVPHFMGETQQLGPPPITYCGGKPFLWGKRTYIMGIINVTPDSFSGDGTQGDINSALSIALRMQDDGADIIDIGGESTRRYNNQKPADPIPLSEELRRLLPVVEHLYGKLEIPISIDTYKAEVAKQCISLGASMINNVWGVKNEIEMIKVIAESKVPTIVMHNQTTNRYSDLICDIIKSLDSSIKLCSKYGVKRENIIIDPGIGFGKVADQSIQIENRLREFHCLGQPLLVGPSRKSHIGMLLNDVPANERLEGTCAAVSLCIAGGADIVRVHDVRQISSVVKVSDAIVRGWRPDGWNS